VKHTDSLFINLYKLFTQIFWIFQFENAKKKIWLIHIRPTQLNTDELRRAALLGLSVKTLPENIPHKFK